MEKITVEERKRELKEEIISSVNRRLSEKVSVLSAREKNLLLNDIEYSSRKINMESTPEGIGIGAHYACNAKCIFCLGGKPKFFSLDRYREFFKPLLGSVIAKARYVNFCGFGELFLMPRIEEFLDYVDNDIPFVNKIYTTNGIPLAKAAISERLVKSYSAVQVSLHASHRRLHQVLTRIESFDQILASVRQLVARRRSNERPGIVLVFIANTLNIEDLPDFVKLASDIGVNEVCCSYMKIFSHSHLKLSCFFKQKITNESFSMAEEIAAKTGISLKLPLRFGCGDRVSLPACSDPWKYFYVENETSVLPCCHAGSHIGYLAQDDFSAIWNGPVYKYLRSCVAERRQHNWCSRCYKNCASAVDDIRSHINFSRDVRKILKKA